MTDKLEEKLKIKFKDKEIIKKSPSLKLYPKIKEKIQLKEDGVITPN